MAKKITCPVDGCDHKGHRLFKHLREEHQLTKGLALKKYGEDACLSAFAKKKDAEREAEKVPTKDGFTYNHTALVYLMGRDGRLAGTINYQDSVDTQVKKLRRVIGG